MKKSIISVLLLFMFSMAIQAQEKYDYAVIYYGAYQKPFIGISVDGAYSERNLEKDEIKVSLLMLHEDDLDQYELSERHHPNQFVPLLKLKENG